jgi:BRCA1-associated protein
MREHIQLFYAMPSYHYHLKFELYPSDDPSLVPEVPPVNIWIPSATSTIFDDLPSHPRNNSPHRSSKEHQKSSKASSASQPLTSPESAAAVDRGPPKVPSKAGSRLSDRQLRERTKSFPPPGFTAGLGPQTVANDWRFGPINIESFDLARKGGGDKMADYIKPLPASSLGPMLGGNGQATRARFESLETKNTEAGWGVVHLYREVHEGHYLSSHDADDAEEDGEDGTILCIPSVPVYLFPSDFLGFINEKWREHISHYRMVMTSRMNRYMVLLKFRDNKSAREWRKEFDGIRFNPYDVSLYTPWFPMLLLLY